MLKIEDLTKIVKDRVILNKINLKVDEGMIYGFIGHNGAGKTTTMKSILGLTNYNSGKVIIDGKEIIGHQVLTNVIGYLPENPMFYNYMTAIEYMGYLNRFQDKKLEKSYLELVGLYSAMHKKISTYSRGMQQRLGMAVAMIFNPKLMILDEPTSALDPAGRFELFEMIKQLRANGTTILLSTHILDDIEKISDKIGIIKEGEIIREDSVARILDDYFHPIYDVQLNDIDNIEDGMTYLNDLDWTENNQLKGNQLTMTVNDVARSKTEILKAFYESGLHVTGFRLRQPSLEEVFMNEIKAVVS